jgi:mycothiol synthase
MDLETELDWRPLDRAAVPDWLRLLAAMEETDHEEEILGEDDLLEEFDDPCVDFGRGSRAAYHEQTMVGYGVLTARTLADTVHNMRFRGGVHPAFRGQGLGSALLDWAEQTAPSLHRERFAGLQLSLTGRCLVRDTTANRLYARRGYHPSRWYLAMTCDISHGVTHVAEPSGVRIAGFTPGSAADALLVRNEAFHDHWDSTETTPDSWTHFLAYSAFRPAFSFVAYARSEPVGVIISHEYEAYNEVAGVRDLYIPLVGTRRSWRGRGIAAALLSAALTAARADGFGSSALSVDAGSPTGAVGLYERVGFTVKDTWVQLTKDLAVGS